MFKNKKKVLALTISTLILFLSFGSTCYAATAQSTLTAQFKALKILLNGSQITMESQPILVNGSTYLPLRAFANLFNKNVDWNAELQQVSITDKPDNELASLKSQIVEKDNQILILQAQLTAKSDRSLTDMKKQLTKDYDDYESLDVTITLSGSKSKITVKVDVGSKSKWNKLSSTKQTKLLQNIADDLDDEYDDPSISGTVKAGSTTISSFTVNSSGKVKLSSEDLSDVEDDLNDDYDELGGIDDLEIELDGDEDLVTFTIYIDYDDFEEEWDSLSDSKISTYMKNIHSDIEDTIEDMDEYEDANVSGKILDISNNDKTMASLTKAKKFSRASSYSRQ